MLLRRLNSKSESGLIEAEQINIHRKEALLRRAGFRCYNVGVLE